MFREGVADPANVSVQAVSGPFMAGVVITMGSGERWLFWTFRQHRVLEALRANGAQVVESHRRVHWKDLMGY
jgi:hypothetical protein